MGQMEENGICALAKPLSKVERDCTDVLMALTTVLFLLPASAKRAPI